MTIYDDYTRDRIGWFWGLGGAQLATVVVASAPVWVAVNRDRWGLAGLLLVLWLVVLAVVVVPVRGRSATGWAWASLRHGVGSRSGWTSYAAAAATGRGVVEDQPDLPGVLSGVQVHDGPPYGASLRRVAVVQDHAMRSWAVTAAVVHPGIGMEAAEERRRFGEALSGLLDLAGRSEKVAEVIVMVRTVPEDGAERDLWVRAHRRPGAPELSRRVNADLGQALSQASVRTEQFVTLVVPENRIGRAARESGGGLGGRCRELHLLMSEVEAHLRGPLGMRSVTWLTSPELAVACRTGFAPSDRAGIVQALAEAEQDPQVNADVPWSMAGPSGADATVRHYSHDAWNSVSATVKLPTRGAAMGALAPVLTPGEPGERRSFMVCFPIVPAATADRQTGNAEWAADTTQAVRVRLGVRPRARQREDAARAHGVDTKLHRGHALTRPYAVCTVTVPKTARVSEFGRRLDASIRRAGFAPLRLDMAHDTAFAASTLPLGISLTRRSGA